MAPSGGPDVVYRYNRFRAVQILGGPAPGYSSGEAVTAMEQVAAASLPQGFSYEWTGTTYQQKLSEGSDVSVFDREGHSAVTASFAMHHHLRSPPIKVIEPERSYFGCTQANGAGRQSPRSRVA